jgi:hypothetical protein
VVTPQVVPVNQYNVGLYGIDPPPGIRRRVDAQIGGIIDQTIKTLCMVDAAWRRTRHHDANIRSGVPLTFKDRHELLQLAHGCCMSPHTGTSLDAYGITERAFRGRSTTELGMEEPCYRQQPLQDVHAQRV